MVGSSVWRPFRTLAVTVDADPRLVRQLLGAVVTQKGGELGGHRYQRLQKVSDTEAVVRFEVSIFGRDYSTTERVVLDGEGVDFQQLTGSVPAVEERISVAPWGRQSRMTYRGRFQSRGGRLGALLSPPLVRWIYALEGSKTLQAVKKASEIRQAGSALFRRTDQA